MAEGMEYRVLSDGRRLDVLLSEETGLSRSRVASLMEDGLCVSGGKACTKAGTKLPAGQEIILRRRRIFRWKSCMRMKTWLW